MNTRQVIRVATICGWPFLGFTRGIQSYDYHYTHDKLPYRPSGINSYLYTDAFLWGVCSACAYVNPFTFVVVCNKEVYRLEVNLRGMEEEKKSQEYNKVLW